MDTVTLLTFLTGGSLVATLITEVAKKYLADIADRYGSLATQVVLLVVCILIAFGIWAMKLVPTGILVTTSAIFAEAITIYEVLYKAVWQQAIRGKV